MKTRALNFAVTFVLVALPGQAAAQLTRYKFIDIPTLGGPAAEGQVDGLGLSQYINELGIVVGGSDIPVPDPNAPNTKQLHPYKLFPQSRLPMA